VLRVLLIFMFGLLVGETDVKRHLVGLVHHGPVAAHHFAHVEMEDAGDAFQILISAGDNGIGRLGFGRVGPKNDNV
jgi:hypothetical protein